MHTIYIHIDEELGQEGLRKLKDDLLKQAHITDVEVSDKTPHDLLVEFEEDHVTPMAILREIGRQGLHADIMTG